MLNFLHPGDLDITKFVVTWLICLAVLLPIIEIAGYMLIGTIISYRKSSHRPSAARRAK